MAAISLFVMFSIGLFVGIASQFLISRWLKAILVAVDQYPARQLPSPKQISFAGIAVAVFANPSGWLWSVGAWLGVTRNFGTYTVPESLAFLLGLCLGHVGLVSWVYYYLKERRSVRGDGSGTPST